MLPGHERALGVGGQGLEAELDCLGKQPVVGIEEDEILAVGAAYPGVGAPANPRFSWRMQRTAG
jgi:hypothetical protein